MGEKQEKKYLKFSNKLFYGMGDFASNYVMSFVSFFLMIYLTDTVGLNSAIIGTLMLAAKLFDGVSDMIFGNMIDRTNTKWGKAKPWMFFSTFPMCLGLVLEFAIPNMGETAQYAYFFVVYVLLNSVFYTANNISYSTLNALVTKNQQERVQLGTIRFIFAFSAMMVLSMTTNGILQAFGGGAEGWRKTAILYAVFACIVNTISCLSVKELSPEEGEGAEAGESKVEQKVSLLTSLKVLVRNKYFFMVLGIYIAFYLSAAIIASAGVYYASYVLGDMNMMGLLSMAVNLPIIIGLFVVPLVVNKFGIYKTNQVGSILTTIAGIVAVYAGFTRNVPLLLTFVVIRSIFNAPLMGTLNTWIAEIAEYSWKKEGIHIEGIVFSCTSIGNKIGSGFGGAMVGWLLAAAGYVGTAATQPASAITMIMFIYAAIPAICFAIIAVCCYFMKIDKALEELK